MQVRKKYIVLVSLLVLAGFILGCSGGRGRLEKGFVNKVNVKCPDADAQCQIDLNFIDWVDWDTMTVFSAGADNLEINRILGENVVGDNRPPMSIVLALRRDGRVVHIEDAPRNTEGYNDGDVEFEDIDPLKRFVEYPRNSRLAVQRVAMPQGTYYMLKCIDCK